MKDTTTGEDFFIALQEVLQKHSIKWDKIVNITTDGCLSLIGKKHWIIKKIKGQNETSTRKRSNILALYNSPRNSL